MSCDCKFIGNLRIFSNIKMGYSVSDKLALSQTAHFRLFQNARVCRQQFKI